MLCAFSCCGCHLVDMVQVHIAHMGCPGTRPHLKDRGTIIKERFLISCHINDRNTSLTVYACYRHSMGILLEDITCCCGSELSALFVTTLTMGLHAGSPACKPLYIGPPGPSAMGG